MNEAKFHCILDLNYLFSAIRFTKTSERQINIEIFEQFFNHEKQCFDCLIDDEDAFLCEIDEKGRKKKLDILIDFMYNSELLEFLALIKECRQLCEEYWAKFVEKNEHSMH